MILFRNRLIFGIIWKTIKVFFTVIYSIFSFFNLQFALLIGLIGTVLYFTGTFEKNRAVLIIFTLILVLSIIYAVVKSIRKLLGIDKKVKRSKGVQIVGENQAENKETNEGVEEKIIEQNVQNNSQDQNEQPKYYKVKQNPSFIMAEYSDRYELFKIEDGKLKKVRTDFKVLGE